MADAGTLKVLVILGHPRKESLCGALAEAYVDGARAAGLAVERLDLASLAFDPSVHRPDPKDQPLEPELRRAQNLIQWADHLVFVYPAWWGTMPALLKGFLDRCLTPGFAFRFEEGNPSGWLKLLAGRSAQLLVTMDTPPWVFRWITRQPGHQAMRRATLGFCGIRPTFITSLGPVRTATPARRLQWLASVRAEALRLPPRLAAARRRARMLAWLRLLRLQFYPMTWVAYTVGTLLAAREGAIFSRLTYWTGYLCVFLAEVLTVVGNEWFDQETDRRNREAGPFNGGSRVLVEGDLPAPSVRRALRWIAAGLGASLVALACVLPAGARFPALVVATICAVAVGYTVPPLKLVYRGLGELDVGFTHSFAAILCGAAIQSGSWQHAAAWLLGLPLFLATLAAITLSGIPDLEADQSVAKRTLPVLLGPQRAAQAALALTLAAAAAGLFCQWRGLYGPAAWGSFLAAAHGLLLAGAIRNLLRRGTPTARMDGLMALALAYLLWFGLIPLLHLA